MFSGIFGGSDAKFDKTKLKNHLRMVNTRVKMLQSKRTNLAKRNKTEIAGLLKNEKYESARVRVESVMHDDDAVEGMEMVSLFTELLIARVDVIADSTRCPPDIKEPLTSLLWASNKIDNVPEMQEIQRQIAIKFGRGFLEMAHSNSELSVNPSLMFKLTIRVPDPELITTYLKTIAAEYDIMVDEDLLADPSKGKVLFENGIQAKKCDFADFEGDASPECTDDEIDIRLQSLKRQ
eukprot:PhF_6_TR4220/c0_g1_i1/m.5690/K19476/IST1; vacuolar protein sorting-associated protein IST1